MSLSRSPSPQRGGGWASPGLTTPYNSSSRRASPIRTYPNGGSGASNVSWASAQAKSAEVRGYPSFEPRRQGFAGHLRKFSAKLPYFNGKDYADKEKLGRGRGRVARAKEVLAFVGRVAWRFRLRLAVVSTFLLCVLLFYVTPLHRAYRRSSMLGGGNKFVIILGANEGGGVMEWKGPREWAIERDSIKNKKNYAKRWGYELEIVDMSTKKRYAHEWRESWEKADIFRNAMRKYPHAEWFWWVDLNTFIMEPTYSLQSHIFNQLNRVTYRDINHYNPLNISHPLTEEYLDENTRSAIGDGRPESINLLVPQDCSGFNLGSFFMRRSVWTDRLLDIWWDPVGYEQKHMEWEHKEQDALEYLYTNQPWIRPHVAFLPQRRINSFPPGACGEKGDNPKIHYSSLDRDFLVNMAGCEWGRDCWKEMYNYRQLSNRLNRNPWERFKDGISEGFEAMLKRKKVEKKTEKKEEEKKEEKKG
ncbi:hypothetical protein EJ06DRAFT_477200 [Trichodelitschia bisporula]|uniref:Glycosyltransferase family 34 protein n=1 Tax=Trichodelitschia bisporula TaxID=703511 RepID=A0A6G1HWV3_9PEZI|nr:hypothetical protein EJ06DRAFT_477200 [Trichodelitschia bisporula]